MSGGLRIPLLAMGLLCLSACATRAPRAELPAAMIDPRAIAAAEAQQAERARWLQGQPQWSFEGRVAINSAGKGGNGRIEWQQHGSRYVVSLSAPVTRQSWRLTGDTHYEGGRLEGLEGGPRESEDAEALLLEATGWDIPVNALAEWARGLTAPGYPADKVTFGSERLLRIEQAGWRIDYSQWHPSQSPRPALPRRIDAQRDQASVRLIVDRWDFSPQ